MDIGGKLLHRVEPFAPVRAQLSSWGASSLPRAHARCAAVLMLGLYTVPFVPPHYVQSPPLATHTLAAKIFFGGKNIFNK